MISLLCDNPEQAANNRRRVKEGYANDYYVSQARAVAQWPMGEPAPRSVVLGELPRTSGEKRSKRYLEGE
jgi:hypothetical protein